MTSDERRFAVLGWFDRALAAVDPETLTAEALSTTPGEHPTVIAIGKAAAAMCRGAARALGRSVEGICVTTTSAPVPEGIELMIGDHPVPGPASLVAGERVLEIAGAAKDRCVALISGGGSALCEHPLPGIDPSYLGHVNETLIDGGASIEEINLVRAHLSAIKGGGVARAASCPVDSYLLSDVGPAPPEVIASGPTIASPHRPELARDTLHRYGIEVSEQVWAAMSRERRTRTSRTVEVLGNGLTAAEAAVAAARAEGVEARPFPEWLSGPVEDCLDRFLAEASDGVTVAAGEPTVIVEAPGSGGRNTHAALLAAQRLVESDMLFAALATDGVDGRSEAAGAIVDGSTLARGGDPAEHLRRFSSATYLDASGDLVRTGPTETNVADLWVLWKP